MNGELQDIYRRSVLSHSQAPHNQRRLKPADREVTGFNRLCGDKLTIYLNLSADRIQDIAFEGTGCAISIASASMMTDALEGVSIKDAAEFVAQFDRMLSVGTTPESPRLKETKALEGVRQFPSRIKCASLAWSAVEAALNNNTTQISTE